MPVVFSNVFLPCLARTLTSPIPGDFWDIPSAHSPPTSLCWFSSRPGGVLPCWCTALVFGKRLEGLLYIGFWGPFFVQLAPQQFTALKSPVTLAGLNYNLCFLPFQKIQWIFCFLLGLHCPLPQFRKCPRGKSQGWCGILLSRITSPSYVLPSA